MSLRITNAQQIRSFIAQVQDRQTELDTAQAQVSSGYRVSNASDDPGRAGTIVNLKSTLDRIEGHEQRIVYAENLLVQQENLMEEATNILIRAQELAAQGANEANSVDNREAIAQEIFTLRDAMVDLANSKFRGIYIFGGSRDDTAPFVLVDPTTDPNYTYPDPADNSVPEGRRYIHRSRDPYAVTGTDVTRTVNITDSLNVRVNSDGNQVFTNAIEALEGLGRALEGFSSDTTSVPVGGAAYTDPGAFDQQTADIQSYMDTIEAARVDEIGVERTSLAGRLARVDLAKNILTNLKFDTETARSGLQDVDLVQAATDMTAAQQAIEATLSSGAQIIRGLSLLDFL